LWTKSEFKQCCNASQDLVLTQENTVMGQKILYETNRKKSVIVKKIVFHLRNVSFQEPLWNQTLGHCAVVGNGGILNNSRCGQQIDKVDFVIRLNLPPLNNENDVGKKTSLVTANPTILRSYTRKSFAKMMEVYGQAVVLMPAFSYVSCTEPSFRAYFTLKDFNLQNVTFFHPEYLLRLNNYWKSKGLLAQRLSSGMMLVSIALELCSKVTLYGFWPFSSSLNGKPILHHYYDNVGPKQGVHKMSEEFLLYMQMHSKGLLQLKIGIVASLFG
uniref:ST8 alpha-N-acetyl-neuraminide alpha-2,8-sialyltransferase 7.1 n=1 Tax=Erpetoichthys calabaricus TaxID=27687 RepID=A0A8C4SGF2_ERPCA